MKFKEEERAKWGMTWLRKLTERSICLLENEIEVVFQVHLLGSRFHFRAHPLFALKLHFQFLLFLFGGFWFWFWKDFIWIYVYIYIYIYIYEFESEKASETMAVSTRRELQESEKTSETMAVSAGRELRESDFHFYVKEEKWNIRNKRVDWNLKLRWARKLLKLVKNCWKQLANRKVNGKTCI